MVSCLTSRFFKKGSFIFSLLGFFFVYQNLSAGFGEWEEVFPEGQTLCARGEPFSFFVRRGTGPNPNLVVDHIGGGACWDANTCSVEGSTYVDSVDMVRDMYEQGVGGIYDHNNPKNPLKNWTHVVIPYCTGDIHWGENDKVYTKSTGETFTIHHRWICSIQRKSWKSKIILRQSCT